MVSERGEKLSISIRHCIVCQCESGKKKKPPLHCVSLSAIVNQVQKGIRQCESGKKKYPPSSGQKRKSIRDGDREWRTLLESRDYNNRLL